MTEQEQMESLSDDDKYNLGDEECPICSMPLDMSGCGGFPDECTEASRVKNRQAKLDEFRTKE